MVENDDCDREIMVHLYIRKNYFNFIIPSSESDSDEGVAGRYSVSISNNLFSILVLLA